ncbi:hypothetical protein F1C76_02150 [Geodermatophilaceae bacterium NBWT11]|nr:hypothetical protein F1C76_02150 [Geodermatophilaceae bacterium NBWT11]
MSVGPQRRRVLPEIAMEVDDFIALVGRHLPALLRPTPDRLRRKALDDYWTAGIWTEVANDDRHSHQNQVAAASQRASLIATARENKTSLGRIGFDARQLHTLLHLTDERAPASYLLGWDGSQREAWRVQLRDHWFRALIWSDHQRDRSAALYREWAGCHLDLDAISAAGPALTELFLSTVQPIDLPHAWFRWAVNMAQEARKIGSGNAVDNQHSAYLPNADLFITADRRMADALAIASGQTPFPVAHTLLAIVEPLHTFASRIGDLLQEQVAPESTTGSRHEASRGRMSPPVTG